MRKDFCLDQGIQQYLEKLQRCIAALNITEIRQVLDLMVGTVKKGSRIFICGNGGSAVTASHLAGDLNKGFSYGREDKFRVICLSDNIATLTAYANDIGYKSVFIEQIRGRLQPDDLVVGISGSGNSANVLAAVEYANTRGVVTLGLTGYDGGKLKTLAKYSCNAAIDDMQISEDIHMILSHLIMSTISNYYSSEA